jgi:hypothetical protein
MRGNSHVRFSETVFVCQVRGVREGGRAWKMWIGGWTLIEAASG